VSPVEIETYLHEHIPLSKAMAVHVLSVAPDCVVLQAPLAPNINHRETVFGGSASALAILSGWSLLHVRLRAEGVSSRLVIQRNAIEYDRPIPGEFTARACLERPDRWDPFMEMLDRRGKARIGVLAMLEHADEPVARFSGEFVALRSPERA
jgi:thioesterase domain-containing protein